jgi:urease accessory protein
MRELRFFETSRLSSSIGLGLLLVAVIVNPACAHEETGKATGFLSGVQHPISGLDHVIAMIAVGLWGAQLGAPAFWLLPVAFPIAMASAGMIALMGFPLPGVEAGIAVSALVLAVMVLLEQRPPLWVAALIVGFFAIFHGHAHGAAEGASGLTYSIGFVIATGLLHAIGIGIGLTHRWSAGRGMLRAAGGSVAVFGLVFLWRALM